MNEIAASPENALRAANQFYEQGKYNEAKQISAILFNETKLIKALVQYALCCFQLKEYNESLRVAEALIEALPNELLPYEIKVESAGHLQQPQLVLDGLTKMKLLSPSNSKIDLMIADVYQRAGQVNVANNLYKNYLKMVYPDNQRIDALSIPNTHYHIEHLRKLDTPYADFPLTVSFETFAQCDAKCSFCVYPDLERIGTKMPIELIDKIIDDLTAIPQHIPFQLSPFGVNEPFLDKRIFDILDKIVAKLPNALIAITTNTSPLTPEKFEKLCSYKLDYLWMSVVDYRKDVYEEKMKLSFDRTIGRLEMIHAAKASGRFNNRCVISRLMDHTEHDQHFINFFKERFPLFEICLWPYTDWIGKSSNPITSKIEDIPCGHWFSLRISATGLVQHCCMDGHVEFPWGDVNKNSALEIYNQESYRKLRTGTFSRLDASPCNRCNLR